MFNQMERVFFITILVSCLLLVKCESARSGAATAPSGGIKPMETEEAPRMTSEIAKAVMHAWDVACNSTHPTTILIPEGEYTMKEAVLKGPCKGPIEIKNEGFILNDMDPLAITKNPEWVSISNVENITLSGKGIYHGQSGRMSWKTMSDRCASGSAESCSILPNNFLFDSVNNSVVKDIISKDSKSFHMLITGCNNFTVMNVTIDAPATVPNTDGIHITRTSNVAVRKCDIKTGDDCISIGDGSKNINITAISCGPGHGISVGSLGRNEDEEPVKGIFVNNCTFNGTDNGVRIKTWPSSISLECSDLHFENIKMENVSNPILIDQLYCPSYPCKVDPPSSVQISNVSYKDITGTSATPEAVKLICSKSLPCKDVEFGNIDLKYTAGSAISNCSNVTPTFTGTQAPSICK